jgi:hypothetical protein
MRQRQNARLTPGPITLYLCCLAFILLQACQPGAPDSPFKRYLNQLDLALSVAPPIVQATPIPPAPEAGELQLAIPPSSIDRLDFLQLSGCAVQANIGKRQTSLGQFAKPSQRLFLELEYLRLAPACINRLRVSNNHPLAGNLEVAWQAKQAQLPALIFNATLGSDEYRAFWLAVPAPGEYPRSDSDAIKSALQAINEQTRRWLNGDYRAHNRDLELLLSEVAGGDGGARLQDWSRQIDWLATANLMVEQGLTIGALCSKHKPEPAALRRTAIARSYFIDVIQPLVTQSQLHYLAVMAPVTTLETQLKNALPPAYRRWAADRNQRVTDLSSAPGQHLEQLSRIQQTCSTD